MGMMSSFGLCRAFAFEAAERSDEEALRCCLDQIVAARHGRDGAIKRINRRQCDDGSSYATEAVTLTLAGGEQFKLFVKYFGSSRYHKQEPGWQAERETRVYRDVLARADLGTAEYLGVLCDKSRGRLWLFLEYVGGATLAYRELEWWTAAAGWLARLHRYFADDADRIRPLDFLLTHDRNFFQSTAEHALTAVAATSTALADRLDELVCRYGSCIDVIVNQPATLVHGSFKPRHVLVDDRSERPRLCPIDWELAASGSNLYDLAFLAHGLDRAAVEQLLDAYSQEALAHNLPLPEREQMRYIVDCLRLHRILKALGRAQERAFPETRIVKEIEAGERLARRVCC
jgi:Phosphotransferase enzyme family